MKMREYRKTTARCQTAQKNKEVPRKYSSSVSEDHHEKGLMTLDQARGKASRGRKRSVRQYVSISSGT
jgi:hypothetical protein